ncbi:MAG: CRISPR-associated endonuclease Cas1 [Gemmatimonadaceae bacterium]|nr:CRISPR-associated endonuclease Cas1 [Gemmatimonadaceae bacterium]
MSETAESDQLLVPARMVNEYVYCPRLAYLEWVQGEWSDNLDTIEGRWVHRRVDVPTPRQVPDGSDTPEPAHELTARSVLLSSEVDGLIARVDLLEMSGRLATPVEYKKGAPPDNAARAYDPERVQLAVQAMILRANGYHVERGVLYFAEVKERVDVPIDDALVSLATDAIRGVQAMASSGRCPAPLVDSPKCTRCSLNGICLLDETNLLAGRGDATTVRRLVAPRPVARPLYVQEQGSVVKKVGDTLVVTAPDADPVKVLSKDISAVVLHGNIQVTTQAIRALMEDETPVMFHSFGGWFVGQAGAGIGHRNVSVRMAQHRALGTPLQGRIAAALVAGKVQNQRTLLRRNLPVADHAVTGRLAQLARQSRTVADRDTLLGMEGYAARTYFAAFPALFRERGAWAGAQFRANGRNRRPPLDPVNAVLSFLYSHLVRECTSAALQAGFDPYVGILHEPHHGRASLALDLMEEFRPLVADSVCITLFNQGELEPSAFHARARGVMLTPKGRRVVLAGFERRLEQFIMHPVFGYQVSYRRLFDLQARMLRAVLLAETAAYRPFTTR